MPEFWELMVRHSLPYDGCDLGSGASKVWGVAGWLDGLDEVGEVGGGQNPPLQKGFSGRVVICSPVPTLPGPSEQEEIDIVLC